MLLSWERDFCEQGSCAVVVNHNDTLAVILRDKVICTFLVVSVNLLVTLRGKTRVKGNTLFFVTLSGKKPLWRS